MDVEKILKEKFVEEMGEEYITVNDFTLPRNYETIKKEIDNFEVRENDIWICSFPKSGTTWTQEMVWMIINNLDFEKAKENLEARSPFLEYSMLGNLINIKKNRPDYDVPLYKWNSVQYAQNQKCPRAIKTHLPFELLPNQIKDGSRSPKMICITREPKDVCVSFYHHYKLLKGFTGSFDEFCEIFLNGRCVYGPYWKHVMSYWPIRKQTNVLFLKYENMKQNLGQVITMVANFLEHSLTEKEVDNLTNHLSFESMKCNSSVNKEDICKLQRTFKLVRETGNFMRSGTTGDFKNFMSSSYIKKFDEWIKLNTKQTDYVI